MNKILNWYLNAYIQSTWPDMTFLGLSYIIGSNIQYIHYFDLIHLFVHLFLFNFHKWNEHAIESANQPLSQSIDCCYCFFISFIFIISFVKYAHDINTVGAVYHIPLAIISWKHIWDMRVYRVSFVRSVQRVYVFALRIFVALTSFDNRITFRHTFLVGYESFFYFFFFFLTECYLAVPVLSYLKFYPFLYQSNFFIISISKLAFSMEFEWCKISQFTVILKRGKRRMYVIGYKFPKIECISLFNHWVLTFIHSLSHSSKL